MPLDCGNQKTDEPSESRIAPGFGQLRPLGNDGFGVGYRSPPTCGTVHWKNSMRRIFLDTEFTQFRDGQLLSLGLVTDDGHELYVEIADSARHARASDFCRDEVISQFGLLPGTAVRDDAAAGARVANWLDSFEYPLAISYDYKLDWRFFEGALRAAGQWQALASKLRAEDVAGVAAPGTPGEAAQNAVFDASNLPRRHHALVDARALRAAWQASSMQG